MKDISIRIKTRGGEFFLYTWQLVEADFSDTFKDYPFSLCIRRDCGKDFLCDFNKKSGILEKAYKKNCGWVDSGFDRKNEAQQYLDICGITSEQVKSIYSTLKQDYMNKYSREL